MRITRSLGTAAAVAVAVGMGVFPVMAGPAEKAPAAGGRSAPGIELGSPFVEGAILQRQMPVPVWGWARPGSTVTVSFAGQRKTATADGNGRWMVRLEPLEACSEGRDLTVRCSEGGSVVCKGVLVGEVWFASGQSNMEWVAGKSMCRELAATLQRAKQDYPVREYAVDIGSAIFPCSRASSADGWKSSKQAGSFSALCLAFAWTLYEELKVPIGILRASHGATPIETWTAYEGFADHPKLQDIALKIRQSDPRTPEGRAAYEKFYADLRKWRTDSAELIRRGGSALPRPALPGIADEWKGPSRMYNRKIAPLIPYAIRGAIWCQGTSNAGDGKIYADKMEALVAGWRKNWNRPDLPFYFTQQQHYGQPDPNHVGFADLREAQTLFFRRAKNVGMVPQYDLNSAHPTGIHYFNKLDPGKRLARWALAHQYGRNIPYTGPIFKSYTVRGRTVRVQFEQRGPGGGLMVASKGMQADYAKDHSAYVEPARETPGEKLRHFRLAGADKVWHPAEAVIDGNEVVVTSPAVPHPRGVQYAYCGTPMGANLYNRAGLPAVPFAYFDGRQMFNEDDPKIVAAARAEAERKYGHKPFLLPATLFRDGLVLQRGRPVHVWGHGVPGTEVTVRFAGREKTTRVDEFERWTLTLEAMPASARGREMEIRSSNGERRTVRDVLVGDVWVLTGTRRLDGELLRPKQGAEPPPALALVREFRIKTKARRFRTPRKRRMEIGGGKYLASWQPADFDDVGDPPSVAAYHFAARARQEGVPVGIITLGAENPPLTWVSYEGMQNAPGFEKQRDELNLACPDTEVCRRAVEQYIQTVRQYTRKVAAMLAARRELPIELAERAPAFPQPHYDQWASRTETATHTYNFCISPLTPLAVAGVVWIPGEKNIPRDVATYSPSLEVYAASLPATYGQPTVRFLYAHPAGSLVGGIGSPRIPGAARVEFDQWPKSLDALADRLGALAAESLR